MKTQLFFVFLLLLGIPGAAQELVGPDSTLPGMLATFEIIPAQEAAWHIVTPSANAEIYQVDTGLAKLYFSSPEQGRFTIVAGITTHEVPKLLIKTFNNGGEEDKKPTPPPVPPLSSLESWVSTQLPILVKSKNITAEVRLVAGCFEQIAGRIDEGNIKTVQNALSQLQITLTGSLALASPTAVTDWIPFLAELSQRLETELGEKINDLAEVKKILQDVSRAMKSSEFQDGSSIPLRNSGNPDKRRIQNRIFRNLLAP